MRKAFTLGRKADGSVVQIHDDRVPADKQRLEFNNIGNKWPNDITEILYIAGPFKTKYRDKAKNIAQQIKDAEKKASEKVANAEKIHAEAKARIEAEAKSKADHEAAENAKLIAAKEASKAKAAEKPKTVTK